MYNFPVPYRTNGLIIKMFIPDHREIHEIFKVMDSTTSKNNIFLLKIKFIKKKCEKIFGNLFFVDKSNKRTVTTLYDTFGNQFHVTFCHIVVKIEFCITCQLKNIRTDFLVTEHVKCIIQFVAYNILK